VDIDPGAVEIAKLRLWLSLVVDEEDIRQIKPLPNLDYKIVCGNSLLGVEKNLFNNELFAELERLKPFYFGETNPTKKQEFKKQIDNLISQISNGYTEFDFQVYFSEVFHEKGGFDVVIGNPPYGFRNVLSAEEKKYFRTKENIEFSSGDSAELFSKKSFNNLVLQQGVLTFIIPKKSLYGDSWEGWRTFYLREYNPLFLLDASKAFENVLLEQVAFGLTRTTDKNSRITLSYLTKEDEIIEFARAEKTDIFMDNNTIQIYKALFPGNLFSKIQENKNTDSLVTGELGLAIGREFFSDDPTDCKLLKGIDIARWKIKQHRYLKNRQKLNWEEAKKFLKPKVLGQVLIAHIQNPIPHLKVTACYDSEGIIITNTLTAFSLKGSITDKFWFGYLNSSFVSWYAYNFIYSRAIRTMHFYNFYIQQIPVPKQIIEIPEKQKPFINLVDKILTVTKDDDYLQNTQKQAKVKSLEREIDQMVYQLYGLTEEEIAIVEGKR